MDLDDDDGSEEEVKSKKLTIKKLTPQEEDDEEDQYDLDRRLWYAARYGRLEDVKESLADGANINTTTIGGGETPLYVASLRGHLAVVNYLLEKTADPNFSDETGLTPLHGADTPEIADVLIQNGANIRAVTKDGQTVLHTVRNPEVAEFLLKMGAEITAVTKDGQTVLHTVDNPEVAELLLKMGAEITAVTKEGNTALHTKCKVGDAAVVEYLLKKGLQTEDRNNYGETAIHLTKYDIVADCLIANGADINMLTTDHNTVLHSVCKYGHEYVLLYFLEKGFSLQTLNKHGQTPLDIVKEHSDDRRVQYGRGRCLEILKDNNYYSESDGEQVDDDGSSSKPTDEGLRDQTRTRREKDDQEMAELVRSQIEEQGEMKLRNVKGVLTGPPGVGKTVTINRLTGKVRNIALDGGSKSTGIDNPLVIPLYHETEKSSIVIGEQWSPQTIDQQLGTILHCMSQPTSSVKMDENAVSSEILHGKEPRNVTKAPPLQGGGTAVSHLPKPVPAQPRVSLDEYYRLLQEFIRESKWDEVHRALGDVKDTTLFHIIDTGGQPEFFEILPLLLHGPYFSLIFMNLAHPLKDPFQVTYRDTATTRYPVEYDSTYTQLEMIHMLLAAVHSLNNEEAGSQKSAAFLIATHLDQAKRSDIQQIAKEIEDSLKGKAFFEKDILTKYYCLESKVWSILYALDNFNGDEKEMSALREILTNLIKDIFPSESLPTSWGIFHLMLRHKYEDRGFCTLDESIELGKACGLRKEGEVSKALRYLHTRFGTILYYDEVESLKSIVICDPNLLFKPITRLVAESFGANPRRPETAKNIRETGEISYNFFEEICKKDDPLQHIPTKAIVDLLKYHNIVSEIGNGDKKLFMSCLLQPCPPEESSSSCSPVDPAPLLFTFHPHGYQPICLFHVLTSKLLQSEEFELDENRYRNKISFLYGSAEVELVSNVSFLEVRVKDCNSKRCVLLRQLLRKELDTVFAEVPHMRGTEVRTAFYCPGSIHGKESPHTATVHDCKALSHKEPSKLLRCTSCKKRRTSKLEAHHLMWFEDLGSMDTDGKECDREKFQLPNVQKTVYLHEKSSNSAGCSQPSLTTTDLPGPKCLEVFDILKEKSAQWDDFARELDIPYNFRVELRRLNDSSEWKLEAVLRKWMERESHPVTWNTVLVVLNKLKMNDLVGEVREYLKLSKESVPSAEGTDHSVTVCAKFAVEVKGPNPKPIEWPGYGLKLTIPANALAEGVTNTLTFKTVTSQKFVIPPDAEVMSAFYWIDSSHKFLKPVTLQLRHCAQLDSEENASHMNFIVASSNQENLPYHFMIQEGGVFLPHKDHGDISVTSFSIYAIISRIFATVANTLGLNPPNCKYKVFGKEQCSMEYMFDFVFFKDSFITAVDEKYTGWVEEKPEAVVEFEGEEIEITLSSTQFSGWTALCKGSNEIYWRSILSHDENPVLHSCRFIFRWTKNTVPNQIDYPVTLRGACDLSPAQLTLPLTGCPSCLQPSRATTDSPAPKCHEVLDILKKKSARWDHFASELRIPYDFRDELQNSNLSGRLKLEQVLRKWMECKSRPVSWNTVIDVLNELEMKDLVGEAQEYLEPSK